MATGSLAHPIMEPDWSPPRPRPTPAAPWAAGRPGPAGHGGGRQARILVVGDDPDLKQTVSNFFEQHSMQVVPVSGRQGVASQLAADAPTLVILDMDQDLAGGLDLLREIQSRSDAPVIITGSHRSHEADRVIGLELGADDYVSRPFGPRELLARVRAVLRRRGHGGAAPEPRRGRCRFGGWQLDRRLRRLTDPEGRAVALTKGEYALLVAFLDAPQRPLSREQLLQATRVHEDVYDRSIDVQILRLRRKLETAPGARRLIQTERGVGYVFALPVEQA
ncbi:winged helix-turn-helix domain-containing protein [Inquilinus sp.]|uniref:winged helix-turn-helix domain-containing protein n=1 Tax=Inquilinus sp. TaxID=1932117 RepID=UPI0031E1455F